MTNNTRWFEAYGDDESALAFADFIENPDSRVGLADRGYVAFLLREYVRRAADRPLTDSAGELVRLRDSRQQDLEAPLRGALERIAYSKAFDDELGHTGTTPYDWARKVAADALARPQAAPSSSVSPSLTEKDLGSGQERPAPDGRTNRG